jgi:hypothetical protein
MRVNSTCWGYGHVPSHAYPRDLFLPFSVRLGRLNPSFTRELQFGIIVQISPANPLRGRLPPPWRMGDIPVTSPHQSRGRVPRREALSLPPLAPILSRSFPRRWLTTSRSTPFPLAPDAQGPTRGLMKTGFVFSDSCSETLSQLKRLPGINAPRAWFSLGALGLRLPCAQSLN